MREAPPLIAGAGPVGLGAALYLAQANIKTRVIDVNEKPVQESRALAVNPRTLEILESTGITEKMLALGMPIRGVRFSQRGERPREILFEGQVHHKYPFILALSQATTERLLAEALEEAGGNIERGVELFGCRNEAGTVLAELRHCSDDSRETVFVPWLLAADGAHSTARKTLNVDFPGSSFKKPWHLADLPLSTSFEEDMGHVFFLDGDRFVFFIRVIDDASEPPKQNPIWRVISPQKDSIDEVEDVKPAGAAVWRSDFQVSHRVNQHFQVGHVFFAGDAAHIHSPIGARGMNLGLEDAFVFTRLVRAGEMTRYEALRRGVDKGIVKKIELLSRTVMGKTAFARIVRFVLLQWLMPTPLFRGQFLRTVTGLDHPIKV
jgi:2-polyprenyl-6-methoxyphenol hydroxylase-like FAD-dependent oxidoreductase